MRVRYSKEANNGTRGLLQMIHARQTKVNGHHGAIRRCVHVLISLTRQACLKSARRRNHVLCVKAQCHIDPVSVPQKRNRRWSRQRLSSTHDEHRASSTMVFSVVGQKAKRETFAADALDEQEKKKSKRIERRTRKVARNVKTMANQPYSLSTNRYWNRRDPQG